MKDHMDLSWTYSEKRRHIWLWNSYGLIIETKIQGNCRTHLLFPQCQCLCVSFLFIFAHQILFWFYRNIYSHMYSSFGFAGWWAYALQLCQQIITSCLFFTLTNEPKTIQQILVSLNLRFHELTTIISSWISIPFFWRSVEFQPHFFGGVLNLGIY